MPPLLHYTVDVCTECLVQVDLDQTACPLPCLTHPRARVETITVKLSLAEAELFLADTRQQDQIDAEAIERGEG